ncbi:tyrosine phosphatase family-domain-containing protein [Hypoxylon rubiginosum]|uniref:Tyrosine phosphatase family-domain-containing protein n=1 Tax=Hypoxylon rubiginosum TaxID=110542 RepID=A0ACB9YSK7_9PEZI|nr:tyrosine phosphatase family-domain-containing protein [Hypoxylon rubiginosum]
MLPWQYQHRGWSRASSPNHVVATLDDEEAQRSRSLGMVDIRTKSPEVVLREAYVSAMDIAVERPLPLASKPPTNFAVVLPGLYRSAYPEASDFPFMRTLNLKTIVTLVGKELPDGFQQFVHANRITHQIFDMAGTKKAVIPIKTMQSILSIVNDRKNYPLLVHCNQGKHRTGCVIGVLRKINEWDTTSIVQEYSKFAEPKVRDTDVRYLTDFKPSDIPGTMPTSRQVPYVLRTIYGMAMLASFTLYVWIYSSTRLLLFSTA